MPWPGTEPLFHESGLGPTSPDLHHGRIEYAFVSENVFGFRLDFGFLRYDVVSLTAVSSGVPPGNDGPAKSGCESLRIRVTRYALRTLTRYTGPQVLGNVTNRDRNSISRQLPGSCRFATALTVGHKYEPDRSLSLLERPGRTRRESQFSPFAAEIPI